MERTIRAGIERFRGEITAVIRRWIGRSTTGSTEPYGNHHRRAHHRASEGEARGATPNSGEVELLDELHTLIAMAYEHDDPFHREQALLIAKGRLEQYAAKHSD